MIYGFLLAVYRVNNGGFMNTQTTQNLIKIIAILSIALLTSCGTSKSNNSGSTEMSSRVEVDSSKPLASCSQLNDANLNLNIANAIDSNGQANEQWIKVKFNYLSSELTQAGYHYKFYKWRVINNSVQLDQNPLEFYAYNLSNGQSLSTGMTGDFLTNINTRVGYFINLKDDVQNPYQVLKVVAYKTDGTIAAQANVLIPQFLANPNDYKLNPDGTQRADLLESMHPLKNTDISSWNSNQIQQYFDQYCF